MVTDTAQADVATQGARITLAASSESLLELFDALTREYEQSMQMLMG